MQRVKLESSTEGIQAELLRQHNQELEDKPIKMMLINPLEYRKQRQAAEQL